MEGELLRDLARARPRRRGVLHGIESGDRALVAAGNAKILATWVTLSSVMPEESLRLDVNEQIECAHTLASRFYIDPAILEIEKEKIFRRTWQLVGTLSQPCGELNGAKRTIADPETFFTAEDARGARPPLRRKERTRRALRHTSPPPAGGPTAGARAQKTLAWASPRA